MATIINAGTTSTTGLSITTDTSGALVLQTGGVNALSISTSEIVTLANPLPAGSGGTGITSLGANVATFLGTPTAVNLFNAVVGDTGTGNLVFSTSPTLVTPTITSGTLSSPTLTGVPTAPTAAAGTNTTQIATTAFALANGIPSGAILLWSGSVGTIPSGWYLCDGNNSTPDLTDVFIVGAGGTYAVAATGGSATSVLPSHTHSISDPSHNHSINDPTHVHSASSSVSDPGHAHASFANGAPNGGGAGNSMNNAGNQPGYATTTVGTNISVSTGIGGAATGISNNSASTGISNNSTGVDPTNGNLPPYYALCYIMKA